jgi:hypothetical protein
VKSYKELSKLNKTLQGEANNKHLGMVVNPQGELTETIDEMAEVLLNTHFPGSKTQENTITNNNKTIAPHHEWINIHTFKQATANFKNDKAAGPDLIKPT